MASPLSHATILGLARRFGDAERVEQLTRCTPSIIALSSMPYPGPYATSGGVAPAVTRGGEGEVSTKMEASTVRGDECVMLDADGQFLDDETCIETFGPPSPIQRLLSRQSASRLSLSARHSDAQSPVQSDWGTADAARGAAVADGPTEIAAAAAVVPPDVEVPRSAWELDEQVEEHEDPPRSGCWTAIQADHFKVRGATYLLDKVKQPAATESQLLALELFRADGPVHNVAGRAGAPTATIAARCERALHSLFVVVILVPTGKWVTHVAFYFGVYAGFDARCPQAARLLERFRAADDATRSELFKIFPKISEGPRLLKMACPSRPAISGRAMRQRYTVADGYTEVDMDTSQSAAANRALAIAKPISRTLTVDLGFGLEGQGAHELPEVLLGCGRVIRLDLSTDVTPLWTPPTLPSS